MKNKLLWEVIIKIIVVLALAITCNMIGYNGGRNAGYKEACIDFYKGKLKYDLVTNADGTREWKKIEKNSN